MPSRRDPKPEAMGPSVPSLAAAGRRSRAGLPRRRLLPSLLLLLLASSRALAAPRIPSSPPPPRRAAPSAAAQGLKNSIASGLAAACSKALLAPFDTLKTVQQQTRSAVPLTLRQTASDVLSRPGGALNLYAGLGVAVLGAMPSVGLYFGVYSYCKARLVPGWTEAFGSGRTGRDGAASSPLLGDGAVRTAAIAASAAVGNTVASFTRVPFEVVKQELQVGTHPSTWAALSSMARAGGVRAFFPTGGISIQMVRDIPYAIFTLLAYESLRDHWVTRSANPSAPWRDMTAGALAGGWGSYLTNPMDVVKTRIQTDGELYRGSVVRCARMTFEEGGARAFLRGSVPRLMHKVPANGAFFICYEFFRRVLGADQGTGAEAETEDEAPDGSRKR